MDIDMPNQTIFRAVFASLLLLNCSMGAQAQEHNTLQLPAANSDNTAGSNPPYAMSDRIQSAQEIINEIRDFKKRTQAIHTRTNLLLAESRKLKGEAELMQTKTPILPHAAKLTGS